MNIIYTNNNVSYNVIAEQCPLIGGGAVYNARTLLHAYYPEMEFVTDTLCEQAGYRKSQNESTANGTDNVKIYPNPAQDVVYVIHDKPVLIRILDLSGRVINSCHSEAGGKSISLSNYTNGVYLIEIINPDTNVTAREKLIISK